jgi:hypothetical protein
MSIPVIIKHTGIAVGTSSVPGGLCAGPFDTTFTASMAAHKSSEIDVVGATDLAPLVIPLENVVKVRVLVISVSGNSVKLVLTSARGTDQAIPLSSGGLMVFYAPTVGDEFTAIKLVGTGATVSYLIAGNLS